MDSIQQLCDSYLDSGTLDSDPENLRLVSLKHEDVFFLSVLINKYKKLSLVFPKIFLKSFKTCGRLHHVVCMGAFDWLI